jgi:hypothetical protein
MKSLLSAFIALSVVGAAIATSASAGNSNRNGFSSSNGSSRMMRLGATTRSNLGVGVRADLRDSVAPADARNARVLDARAFYDQVARERF